MNPFANSTNHFNHSEPILAAPTSGTCSLLAGFEKDNITRNLFQPCCSSAVAVGYERSTCKSETGWETCFGQHREDSSLIAAQLERTTGYVGPGSFIQDLEFASERIADFAITAVRHDKAINLLGALSILDCPPNGKTNPDDAFDASTAFVGRTGDTEMFLQPKVCHQV
ncbi:hypothetical protein ACEPPN_006578 [Leptodophora sp. 'Broadleaf-Isolate-01']